MKKVSLFTFDVKGKIGKRVIETREDWAGHFEKMLCKSRQKTGKRLFYTYRVGVILFVTKCNV